MDIRPKISNERPGRLGYIAGIAVSALGHAALFVIVFFVMPRYLHSETTTPPAYTVKIVDDIPAGDLGTHLPKLSGHKRAEPKPEQIAKAEPPEPPKVEPPREQPPPPPPAPPEEDKNAVSLKVSSATPTPTPPPPPVKIEPTPQPTPSPKTTHIARSTPRARATPAPKKEPAKHRHKEAPVQVAKAEATPNVQEQLAKIRTNLLKEQLKREKEKQAQSEDGGDDDEGDETSAVASKGESGGGPVAADQKLEGSGYGTGAGTGSAGIQQDLQFLLYYRTVQQKIKDAWTFLGGSNDLTASVTFSIGPDGALTGVKLARSSKNPAFDDSVVRAIRHAAPFPPPPEKYRSEFAGGVEAAFKLGELKS